MAEERITESGKFPQSYHLVWLQSHPWRSLEWLKERTRDGFHIHHVDGDHSNDAPANLVLIDGDDHMSLHGVSLRDGIRRWRAKRKKVEQAREHPHSAEGEKLYLLKVQWDCQWKEVARRYFNDVKPDPNKIWASIGQTLMAKARNYAKRRGKPWPPSNAPRRGSSPDEEQIAAFLSRSPRASVAP